MSTRSQPGRPKAVALRKESVDRNTHGTQAIKRDVMSLSARRAWIEITYVIRLPRVQVSLSARRAWIEMSTRSQPGRPKAVALRKESVDRNSFWLLA